MTKFVAEITVGKRDRLVTLRIPAGNTIAPSLRQVSVTFDGETSHHHREPISSTVLEYHPMPGTHRLEIDFGGPMPAATLILPEQTTAIISPIPALYNDATGMLSTAGHIWNPIKPPRQLTHLVSSLFAHNTHLVALSGTFAGLTALTEVPESLFFPLIYARTFTGVFALSGLAHVSRQLFTANLQAEDFSEAFMGCKMLHTIPAELFSTNTHARIFDRTFAESALGDVPATLFANIAKRGSFVETFARTQVRRVPESLMNGTEPLNVDGMFEPAQTLEHDPMNIKAAADLPQDFFEATRTAAGVPTKRISF